MNSPWYLCQRTQCSVLDNSGLPPPLQTCTHIVHDNLAPLDCQLPLPVSGEVGEEWEEPRRLTCFPSLSRFTAKPPCPHPLPPSSSHVRSWCALNDDIKILTKTNTQTFFRYQILRNRDFFFETKFSETKFSETEAETFFSGPNFPRPNSPKPKLSWKNGKSLETEKCRNQNVNLWRCVAVRLWYGGWIYFTILIQSSWYFNLKHFFLSKYCSVFFTTAGALVAVTV